MKKLTTKLLIIALLFFIIISPVFAQSDNLAKLPDQKIYPGALSYPIKRAWEKFRENLPGSKEDKISLYKELTLTRMAELDYVVSNQRLGEFQTTSERFAYYAGKLTEEAKDSEKSKKDEIKKDFEEYLKKLEKLKEKFTYDSSYWMLIEHSINSLRSYSEKLSK